MQVMARLAACALVILAPLTVGVALGPPIAPGILPLYVQAVVYLSDVPAMVLLLAAGVSALRERRAPTAPLAAPFTAALFALAALGLVTSALALSPPLAAYSALRWLLASGVAWALVRARISPTTVATALCVGLALQVAVGVAQVLVQSPLGLPGERALPPFHPAAAIVATGTAHWLRAYGLTFHPNVLGGFLCVGILLALPLLDRLALRLLWWLLWCGLLLTFSRSAWLATGLTLPVAVAWLVCQRPALRWPLGWALAGVAVLAGGGAVLLAPQVATRLAPLTASIGTGGAPEPAEHLSLAQRVDMARAALVAIRENPLAGVGAGNFPLEMRRQGAGSTPQYVHDVPLLLAAEVGVLGGAVWTAAWLAGIAALVAGWRRLSPEAVAALAAWCAIGVIGLFDSYPWALEAGRLLTAVTVGLVDSARAAPRDG
jgi:hypothetical protein